MNHMIRKEAGLAIMACAGLAVGVLLALLLSGCAGDTVDCPAAPPSGRFASSIIDSACPDMPVGAISGDTLDFTCGPHGACEAVCQAEPSGQFVGRAFPLWWDGRGWQLTVSELSGCQLTYELVAK
jgi:hypothetical protein